jgi:hypothetical protein
MLEMSDISSGGKRGRRGGVWGKGMKRRRSGRTGEGGVAEEGRGRKVGEGRYLVLIAEPERGTWHRDQGRH